jgi:predicted metalloenzyme YecM
MSGFETPESTSNITGFIFECEKDSLRIDHLTTDQRIRSKTKTYKGVISIANTFNQRSILTIKLNKEQ